MSKIPEKQNKAMFGQFADLATVVGEQGKLIAKLHKRVTALEKADVTVEEPKAPKAPKEAKADVVENETEKEGAK